MFNLWSILITECSRYGNVPLRPLVPLEYLQVTQASCIPPSPNLINISFLPFSLFIHLPLNVRSIRYVCVSMSFATTACGGEFYSNHLLDKYVSWISCWTYEWLPTVMASFLVWCFVLSHGEQCNLFTTWGLSVITASQKHKLTQVSALLQCQSQGHLYL